MADRKDQPVDWESLLAGITRGRTVIEYGASCNVFRQGQPADSLFYLRRGKVKLAVTSRDGKEAIVAILDAGEFFGEGCLAGQQLRMATATAVTDCNLFRIERPLMTRLLHEQHEISELFVAHLLSRNIRYEADLVDQLFNSSEKRLTRILLLLSRCFHHWLLLGWALHPVRQDITVELGFTSYYFWKNGHKCRLQMEMRANQQQ